MKSGIKLRQSNIITSSKFEYSALEIDFLIALLLKMQEKNWEGNKYYLVIENLTWLTKDRRYRLIDLAQKFVGRTARFERLGGNGNVIITVASLIGSVDFHTNEVLEIEINERVLPFYKALKPYTEYEVRTLLTMNSKYSKKLYQLLSQYKGTPSNLKPVYTVSIFELKCLLGIIPPQNEYNNPEQLEAESPLYRWSDFKKEVLDKAKNELDKEKAELTFRWWVCRKDGKRNTHISFEMEKHVAPVAMDGEQLVQLNWLMQNGLNQLQGQEIIRCVPKSEMDKHIANFTASFLKVDEMGNPKYANPGGVIIRHFERDYNLSLAILNTPKQ